MGNSEVGHQNIGAGRVVDQELVRINKGIKTGSVKESPALKVGASVEMAMRMGASELFVGLTIVAIGTSLPELAASVAAVRAGHGDMCAGNIVGSNIFNMLLVGGGVSAFVGMEVRDELLLVEFPALLLLSGLLLWFFKSGHVVSRREGVSLLFLYVGILSLSALSQFGYLF